MASADANNPFNTPQSRLDALTDSTIVSIHVLAPPAEQPASNGLSVPGDNDDGATKETKRRFSLFKSRSSSTTSRKKSKAGGDESNRDPIVKDMTYAEYLKHYALDGYGRYVGTEDPAPNCILKNAQDIAKYKMPPEYRALLGDTSAIGQSPLQTAGVSLGMGMGMGAASFGGM